MISKDLRVLRSSLDQPLKSADGRYIGILNNVIKTEEYIDIMPFSLIFNSPCNLNFDMTYAVAQLVEALHYKSEGRGFDSR
jgi:hypothetical protein